MYSRDRSSSTASFLRRNSSPFLSPLRTGMVYTGVRRMGKSGVLSAAKKTRIHFVSRGGKGMRKTVRDAEGRKNRVNTRVRIQFQAGPGSRGGGWERASERGRASGIGKEGSGEAPLLRRWRGIAIFCALVGGDRIALWITARVIHTRSTLSLRVYAWFTVTRERRGKEKDERNN